jgi:hypothetical protein
MWSTPIVIYIPKQSVLHISTSINMHGCIVWLQYTVVTVLNAVTATNVQLCNIRDQQELNVWNYCIWIEHLKIKATLNSRLPLNNHQTHTCKYSILTKLCVMIYWPDEQVNDFGLDGSTDFYCRSDFWLPLGNPPILAMLTTSRLQLNGISIVSWLSIV